MQPIELIYTTANESITDPLKVTVTLQLEDDEGLPAGFISGTQFTEALAQFYGEVLTPINEARVARIKALPSLVIQPELLAPLAEALVDPLIEALASDSGRAVQFCYATIARANLSLPSWLWWSSPVRKVLQRANPGVNGIAWVLSFVNNTMTYFVAHGLQRKNLPLTEHDGWPLSEVHERLRLQVRSSLQSLLHLQV